MKARVLFVDDDTEMCEVAAIGLGRFEFEVITRTSSQAALDLLVEQDVDVVVTDLMMSGLTGLDLCTRIVDSRPDVPVVVVTAFGSLETAIGAIRAGAYDFVTKPFEFDVLRVVLDSAVQHRRLRSEVTRLRAAVAEAQGPEGLLGASAVIKKVLDLVHRVAETDASVLLTGESGTGKELVARAIHAASARKHGPFLAVNCAALPDALLESELFGHTRGAFTDARVSRAGLFAEASGGVIFLDEVGELPMTLQPKLLRALQERKVRPVGGTSEVPFDARIVAATNRDLELMVEEQRFREDLFYRINVVPIALPPLRARGNDILLIAQHFVDHYAGTFHKEVRTLSAPAAARLLSYSWPGNVRELQNCIERAVALTRTSEISPEDLPEKVQRSSDSRASQAAETEGLISMDEMERRHILRAMEVYDGNRGLAAAALGIDRKTLYRKLRAFGWADDDRKV